MDISNLILNCNKWPEDTLEVELTYGDEILIVMTDGVEEEDTTIIVLGEDEARTLAKKLLDLAEHLRKERNDGKK